MTGRKVCELALLPKADPAPLNLIARPDQFGIVRRQPAQFVTFGPSGRPLGSGTRRKIAGDAYLQHLCGVSVWAPMPSSGVPIAIPLPPL